MFSFIGNLYYQIMQWLTGLADTIPPLFLRILLAWEFGEAGWMKYTGENWFAHVTFPFPFNLVPPEFSWNLATVFELAGAVALVIGFATRFFSIALFILTIVAISAVHWPEHWSTLSELLTGYRIIDENGDGFGNYKIPVMYMVMFLPLIFGGAGKLSIDNLLSKRCAKWLG